MKKNKGLNKGCENMIYRPKNRIMRNVIGSLDSCKYLKKISGIHLEFYIGKSKYCPFTDICKHYKPIEL